MISFKSKNDSIVSSLLIAAVVLLLATAAWFGLAKTPVVADAVRSKQREQKRIVDNIDAATKANIATQALIDAHLWSGTAEEVGPEAMAKINKLAVGRHLKVIAFRPQKASEVQGMTQLPFGLTVDGGFPDTIGLIKDLETGDAKLAVNLVQINSSDSSTDRVTGTINFVAYLKAPLVSPANAPKDKSSAKKS